MLKSRHICLFYLSLIILFFSKGILYQGGGIVSKGLLFLLFFTSFIYFIKTLLSRLVKKGVFYWTWVSFFLLNTFMIVLAYLGILGVFNDYSLSAALEILIVSLSFFPIYYFLQQKIPIEKYLLIFFVLILPIVTLQFYAFMDSALSNRGNNTNLVNNFSYFFAFLFPYLFFFKNKKILGIICVFFMIVMAIQGAKRGALLSIIAASFSYYYYYLISVKGKNKILSYIFSFTILLFILASICYFLFNNAFVLDRFLEDDGGSGRDIIYSNLINSWMNSESLFNLLFGHGFSSSLTLSGIGLFAHSDWLELLVNYGLLGVLLYLFMFFQVLLFIFDFNKPIYYRLVLVSVFSIWVVTSIVSMNYMNSQAILQSILLAYIFSSKEILNKSSILVKK